MTIADPAQAGQEKTVRPTRGSRPRGWLWALGLLAVVFAGFTSKALLGQSASPASARAKTPGAVPVIAASARLGELNVYETGLGTVTPLQIVTVRSRVDGQLVSVAYREGQTVRAGDLLAQIDPRPFEVQLHQAEGQLARDEAALTNAKLDLERYRALMAEQLIPKQQLDSQIALVDQNQAALKSDRAQVENAKLNLTYSRITAPIAGVVGLRLVDPGNMVHATDTGGLCVIAQQQPIAVVFTVPAEQLPPVRQQLAAGHKLVVEAWDRELANRLAVGSLLALDNQIDPATGTVRIKGLFENRDRALYPNQFVNARLVVDTLRGVVLVPTAAIQRSPQSTFVYRVKPDQTVEQRDVEVRLTEGELTAIARGLAEGDSVVIDGVDKLQPGTRVAVAGPSGPTQARGRS